MPSGPFAVNLGIESIDAAFARPRRPRRAVLREGGRTGGAGVVGTEAEGGDGMDERELLAAADEYLERHWDDVLRDMGELISIESVEDLTAAQPGAPFGPGPRAALTCALDMAAGYGFEACDCEGYLGYADAVGLSATQIGVIGHVDVVPAGPGWAYPPFSLTRKDGFLLGRGTSDDKGPMVVALHAARLVKDVCGPLPYTVRLMFGANEETNMKDVEHYRAHHADPAFLFTPDAEFPVGYGEAGICSGTVEGPVIEGGDIVEFEGGAAVNAVPGQARAVVRSPRALASSGEVEATALGDGMFDLFARGKSAHASTPELGRNAIGILVGYLLENGVGTPEERAFLEFERRLLSASDGSGLGIEAHDDDFGDLTCVGGVASLIDGRLRQTIDCRYPTTTSAALIAQRVAAAACEAGATFSLDHDKRPFLTSPDSEAVQALLGAYQRVTGRDDGAFTMKGGTYARLFTRAASFGPEMPDEVRPAWVGTMHGPDEGISEETLKDAFRIYVLSLAALMKCAL